MPTSNVIAIFCSDIHLSHTKPAARAGEPDWYEAQARPLRQLAKLAKKHGCPIVCAGDVFDHWNAPAELINFAIRELPPMYAIPGQHDLPHHSYDDIKRSAYWTLVEAEVITNLKPGEWERIGANDGWFRAHPFPWGHEVKPPIYTGQRDIAIIHKYVWREGAGYPGAPEELRTAAYHTKLSDYAYAVFGDNHKGFLYNNILNCGAFMRRKSDEIDYNPAVGLLTKNKDGFKIMRHPLNIDVDIIDNVAKAKAPEYSSADLTRLFRELRSLEACELDFVEAVRQGLADRDISDEARKILLQTLERHHVS